MTLSRLRPLLSWIALSSVLTACDSATSLLEPEAARATPTAVPDAAAGRVAFSAECSPCHASGDGVDLAHFGFPDSTIVRRAVAHVDTGTALNIVAHVRSLREPSAGRFTRLFQVPRAESDLDFARRLLGADAWPDWSESELLAVDPVRAAAAVDFPLWSDEESNLDWMPDRPLDPGILGERDGVLARALAAYHQSPTDFHLARVVVLLRRSLRDPTLGAAPCAQEEDGALADPGTCFEASRWVASFGAQHVIRTNLDLEAGFLGATPVQDAFWDVGQAARRGLLRNGAPVPNAVENWVSWMYLGWIFAPGNHASVYTATGLTRVGLPRHATFVALRSQVDRPPSSPAAYEDLAIAASVAPDDWLAAAYSTGLAVLETREARGWRPMESEARLKASQALSRAAGVVRRRLGPSAAIELVSRTRSLAAFAPDP